MDRREPLIRNLPFMAVPCPSPGWTHPVSFLPANIPVTDGKVYEGTWVGTYSCRQGITGLQLQLKAFYQEQLAGVFSFFPVSSNPNVPYGSFNVNAMLRKDGKLIDRHGNWIQEPAGFSAVNLEGQISSEYQWPSINIWV